jgi:hypothetical protein
MSTRRLLVGASAFGAIVLLCVAGLFLARVLRPPPPPAPSLELPAASAVVHEAHPAEDRTPEIRGRILDADGNAVEGAAVRLVSTSPPNNVYRDAKSGRDGGFDFPHLGPWRARVVADHGADGVVTSAVLRALEGQTLEVTLVLSAASAVRGTVVDTQAHPVAGATVSVEGVPWIVSATSDEAGAFRLTTVPDEATSLVAVARGYRTAHAALGHRDDQTELVVHVVLTAASPVDGEVDDDEGNPVSAEVVACEDQPSEARTRSAADGSFQLPPSAIGCTAVAEDAEYSPSDPAPVVEGGHLALRLKVGGTIEGVVVDERGAGVSPVAVGIESYVAANGKTVARANLRSFEDPSGAFRWDKLGPGTYLLAASIPGRPPARSGRIEVRGGAVTGGVRIVIAPGGTLVGHIYDSAHAPIPGASLHFDFVSSVIDSKAAAQSDDTGQYRLEGAPAGPFTLRVEKDGFRAKLVSGLHVPSGATARQDVTLAPRNGGAGLELGGIGAGLDQTADGVVVRNLSAGDPGATAGLRPGDRIVRIDGEPVDGLPMADVLQRIRGEPGTSVGLSAERPGTGETVEVMIVRGTVMR